MTRILVLSFLLIPFTFVYGQATDRVIVWGGSPECGYKGPAFSARDEISCASLETPRGIVSVVNNNGLSLAVSFSENSDYLIVATFLKNTTAASIDFDSDRWGAAHFRTKEDFSAGKKPIRAETAIPSRDIVKGFRSGVNMDNSIDVFMASISKSSEVKEVRKSDGTVSRKLVIVDDPDAKQNADSRATSRADAANSESEKIRKTALVQKWLPAQGDAKGLVYFRRVKKAELVVFSLKIADVVYVFRLPRSRA